MRPLKTDRASTFERRILDVESTGLGTAVDPKSDLARPPIVLLTVVRYPDGRHVRRWGPRSSQEALEALVEETAAGTDIEVLAHFGGSFDFRLCLEWFLRTFTCRWRFTKVGSLPLSIEGRPMAVTKLRRGAGKHGEEGLVEEVDEEDETVGKFRLLDTYRILPGKLEEIGKAVGLEKGDWDHGWHATRPYAGAPTKGLPTAYRLHAPICYRALAEYCENDTDVLDAGVDKIETFAESKGVHRRLTIASTSTASIRKDLTEETIAVAPPEVRELSKLACFGGRVEVFAPSAGRLFWYDIQSSYPRAMVDGLPWRFIRSRPTWDGEREAIVQAVIEVPECYVPVLPMRAIRKEEGGRVYFPTGEWRGVFYGGELAYAVDRGYAKIISIDTCHLFDRSDIMGEFAKAVWEERKVATGFYKYALKIWLNSAYGKLNETDEREELVVRPKQYVCDRHRETARRPDERCGCMQEVSRELGLYSFLYTREPSFHAPWAAAGVLGTARVRLHEFFMLALSLGGKLFYTDTDCLPTDVEMPTEKGVLGALSHEKTVSSARFLAPKLYGLVCESCDKKDRDGQPVKHPHDIVKAKGFSGMKMSDLEALIRCPRCGATGYRSGTAFGCPDCEGGSLEAPGRGRKPYRFERSEGLGEALKRRGRVDYRRLVFSRALRDTRPKRADGGKRPWTVEELKERWVV